MVPAVPSAMSSEAALVEDGRAIAERNCSSCHAIGPDGPSPHPMAPPFRSVLSRYRADVLETELIEGMRVAHAPMPQFKFKPEATDALIAYLRSVQIRDPGRVVAEQHCARCHAVGAIGFSSLKGAHPLREFGQRWHRGQLRDAWLSLAR